jgi:glycosyltransferase involved in cell wall biosynthesis
MDRKANLKMKTIFVIMASYLGQYPGCSQNREDKFCRAVDSFVNNTYPQKKLIVISDGCEKTEEIYEEKYKLNSDIVCVHMDKQPLFSGSLRNKGIEYAKKQGNPDDVICYIDSDDRFGVNHLKHIVEHFGDTDDFVIWDCHRVSPDGWYIMIVSLASCKIGTGSFAHKVSLESSWTNGYGHDWAILDDLSRKYRYSKIPLSEYYIHHVPNFDS